MRFVFMAALLGACAPGTARQLYVSLPASGTVARVDVGAGRIVATTVVGNLPHNLLLSADGRRVYVALTGSQAVAELDLASGALLRTMLTEPVPTTRADGSVIQPHLDEHAETHTTCFDCHHGGAGGAAPNVVGSRPFALTLSPDGDTLYVTNVKSGNLSLLDLPTGTARVVPLAPTGDAHEPTGLGRLGDDLYVSILPTLPSFSQAVVRRLDRQSLETRGEVATGPNANTLVADPLRERVYASNFETNTLTRWDRALNPIDKITVADGPLGQTMAPGGHAMLVADYYGDALSTLPLDGSAATRVPLHSAHPLSNPTHAAFSEDGRTAWVVSSGTVGNLVELDLASSTVTHSIPVGTLPFDVLLIPEGAAR